MIKNISKKICPNRSFLLGDHDCVEDDDEDVGDDLDQNELHPDDINLSKVQKCVTSLMNRHASLSGL